ncbi:hypothetical protein OH77DRAFT_1156412 [Trametes cingulata]|nr:hypothetical protein OH77DRAFT_1156412 [Trametes cingulata]
MEGTVRSGECILSCRASHDMHELVTSAARDSVQGILITACPINALPSEILERIFSFVPALFPDVSSNFKSPPSILPLLSVCRQWQEVAMRSPYLWDTLADHAPGRSKIPLIVNLPAYQHYLSQFPAGPLCILARHADSLPWVDALFREYGPRVQKFGLVLKVGEERSKRTYYYRLLQSSLPALQMCFIKHPGYSPPPSPSRAGLFRLLPDSSTLRVLQLDTVAFLPSSCFPALVTLHLKNIAGVTVVNLLDFLSGLPRLRHLKLQGLAPPRSVAATAVGARWEGRYLQFPDLQRLVIQEPTIMRRIRRTLLPLFEYQRALLRSCFSFPPSCTVALCGVRRLEDVPKFLDWVWPRQTTVLQAHLSGNMSMRSTEPGSPESCAAFRLLNAEEHLDISFSVGQWLEPDETEAYPVEETVLPLLAEQFSTRRLSTIRRLWISWGMCWVLGVHHCSLLHYLPHIEFLVVTCARTIGQFRLCTLAAVLEVLQDQPLALPRLSTLAVDSGQIKFIGRSDFHECMRRIQRTRTAAGHPLRRLILTDASHPRDWHRSSFDLDLVCREYNADGLQVREDKMSVVYQELMAEWAQGMSMVDYQRLIAGEC